MADDMDGRGDRIVIWQRKALREFVAMLAAEPVGRPSPWLREQFWMIEARTRYAILEQGRAAASFLDLIHPLSTGRGGPRTAASESDALAASADLAGQDDATRVERLQQLIDEMGGVVN